MIRYSGAAMRFHKAPLAGAFLIECDRQTDSRGFFARLWCRKEFQAQGLVSDFPQENISVNDKAGTLRGLHFQRAPHGEVKVIRCIRGALYDVMVDLRPNSPTYLSWHAVELNADDYRALYIPQGFAHGFQTISDRTEAQYMVSAYYAPQAESGLRYDDPALNIRWPLPVSVMSDKDKSWPAIDRARLTAELV
jgi:dTDP-4-dehydrorhamnose 3,5-epimerase